MKKKLKYRKYKRINVVELENGKSNLKCLINLNFYYNYVSYVDEEN